MRRAVTLLAILLGLRTVRIDQRVTRVWVGVLTLAVCVLGLMPSDGHPLVLLACLALARAQAALVWWGVVHVRCTEAIAARLAPDRELAHKVLWAALFALNVVLLLGGRAVDWWLTAPISFSGYVVPVVVVVLICLTERALGTGLRSRPVVWTWLGVQASAAMEEILFRGLVCGLLWPLTSGDTGLMVGLGALVFALPHYDGGNPGGALGVASMVVLGGVCGGSCLWAGALWPGLVLHGVILGTYGTVCSHQERARARGAVSRETALFLVRLRHGYYVTDWEGDRIHPLAKLSDPLVMLIRRRMLGQGDCVAIAHGEFGELGTRSQSSEAAGFTWLRDWRGFLVVVTPEGELPHPLFPAVSLPVLRTLSEVRQAR